jgi:hypothetical protein
MVKVSIPTETTISRPEMTLAEEPHPRPVVWFAAIGAVSLAIAVYVWLRWLIGGPQSTTPGPTDIPTWMIASMRIQEVVGTIVWPLMLYWFVIRPWRREGHVSWDGMLFIAACLLYFQDGAMNYGNYMFVYNAGFVNWGSWYAFIPGWLAPGGTRFAEPVLYAGTWFSYGIFGAIVFFNFLMRKAKQRWPGMSFAQILVLLLLYCIVIDFVMETLYVRTGYYTYPLAQKGWTLWHGHYYQFPLYNSLLWGGCWVVMACLRYFRNDKGESFAERGIERVKLGRRGRTGVRFLAIFGALNVILVVCYQIPMAFSALHAGEWPVDTQKRSYFTNGLCGAGSAGVSGAGMDQRPGTKYACPGPQTPNARRGSASITPEGGVFYPPGTPLPSPVKQAERGY